MAKWVPWASAVAAVAGAVTAAAVWQSAQPPAPAAGQPGTFATAGKATGGAAVAFDPARAMGYLRQLCALGPRISGSAGMAKQQALVEDHFRKLGGQVTYQRFTATQNSRPGQPVSMANMVVTWHPDRPRRVLLCCHYDTRPIADQEPDPRKWTEPFVSANDGTSGVALLMEMAHGMKDLPGELGVDFALFDGEEYIFDPRPGRDKYFFGSDRFAAEYQRQPPAFRYSGAVLLDLCAGKLAQFPVEQHSLNASGRLVEEIWTVAAANGVTAFSKTMGPAVQDDHLALHRVGIPAVDIIDFNYAHWHRLSDLPDECSPETMAGVAKVLSAWVRVTK